MEVELIPGVTKSDLVKDEVNASSACSFATKASGVHWETRKRSEVRIYYRSHESEADLFICLLSEIGTRYQTIPKWIAVGIHRGQSVFAYLDNSSNVVHRMNSWQDLKYHVTESTGSRYRWQSFRKKIPLQKGSANARAEWEKYDNHIPYRQDYFRQYKHRHRRNLYELISGRCFRENGEPFAHRREYKGSWGEQLL